MPTTFEGWFFTISLFFAMGTCISWIAFARLSMARIERRILDDGDPRPCPWDGLGARTLWYAWAIALPVGRWNPLNDPLIDVPAVRRYATRADKIRGMALMIFGYCFMIVAFLGALATNFY